MKAGLDAGSFNEFSTLPANNSRAPNLNRSNPMSGPIQCGNRSCWDFDGSKVGQIWTLNTGLSNHDHVVFDREAIDQVRGTRHWSGLMLASDNC